MDNSSVEEVIRSNHYVISPPKVRKVVGRNLGFLGGAHNSSVEEVIRSNHYVISPPKVRKVVGRNLGFLGGAHFVTTLKLWS